MSDAKELLEVEDPAVEVLTQHLGWKEIDAKKAEEDRDRTRDRLVSAYPHPTEDELNDLVNAQKSRIAHYQEQLKQAPK